MSKTPHVLSFQKSGICRAVRDRSPDGAREEACRAAAAVGENVALIAEDYSVLGRTTWSAAERRTIFEDAK